MTVHFKPIPTTDGISGDPRPSLMRRTIGIGAETMKQRIGIVLAFVLLVGGATRGDDDRDVRDGEPKIPRRWLLLCCGLPGDDLHRNRLTEACQKIISAANPVLGVAPEQFRVLAGDDQMREALSNQDRPDVGLCTKESVAQAIEKLVDKVAKDDSCWIILLGHAHLYDQASQYNVLGPDFDQTEFASWATSLACQEQVFWITTPVSGFWINPLSRSGRVVISATEADLEVTATEMPYALADLMTGKGRMRSLKDIDQDGALTLLDLYLATNLEVHDRFSVIGSLKTEHAQLDDNGDKRGSEVQTAYLPRKQDEDEVEIDLSARSPEGAARAKPVAEPINNENMDGFHSRHIAIRVPQESTINVQESPDAAK